MRLLPLRVSTLSPIGLEIDGLVVRAVQLKKSRLGNTIYAATSFTLQQNQLPDDTAVSIKNILRRRGFVSERITLSVPLSLLESDLLPASSPADAISSHFSRSARCAADAIETAFWPRTGAASSAPAYAIALRHTHATELVAPFNTVGLDIVSLTCPASAIVTLLQEPDGETTPPCTAVLRLGASTHLALIIQGSAVVYQRTLDTNGFGNVIQCTADPATLPATTASSPDFRKKLETTCKEFSATLDCVPKTFGQLEVQRVLLSGCFAYHPAIQQIVGSCLPDIEVLTPQPEIFLPSESWDPAFDLATGLALEEV